MSAQPQNAGTAAGNGSEVEHNASEPRPLTANEMALRVLDRQGYKKGAEAVKNVVTQQSDSINRAEGDVADITEGAQENGKKAIPNTKKESSVVTKPRPIPETSSLALEEIVTRNLPRATSSSTSTAAYNLTPEFMAQAENIVRMHTEKVHRAQTGASNTTGEMPLLDSMDRIKGYIKLRQWVESGLEGWKPELREVLFPVFVHTFLDLVETARSAAIDFFKKHAEHHAVLHRAELEQLKAVNSPAHVLINPYVKRLRTEEYTVNLSRSSFGLLIGWLSDIGLEALWDVPKDTGRYKEAVRHIIHVRLRLKVSESSTPLPMPSTVSRNGLLSGVIPASVPNVDAFNAREPLKLGQPAIGANLAKHTEIQLEKIKLERKDDGEKEPERARIDDVEMTDARESPTNDQTAAGDKDDLGVTTLEPLNRGDILGFGSSGNFASVDLAKEVKAVTDARKRIKLGDKAVDAGATGGYLTQPSLPSVCCYTVFDGGEGTTSTTISDDASYLAAGSAESVIRIWSLKGEDLKTREFGYATKRAQGAEETPNDSPGKQVRKLVGHSGPVYSVAFDPIAGSVYPPSHLLSSSQDGSVRLWSMDTFKNLVAYKGHADPVWAVEWGPYGAYFATASRDRTARLWITDRVAPLRMFAGHLSDVDCVKFHPNSLYLATGSSDRTCRLWDVQRGECVRVFMGHEDAVDCLAMSPDGRYLASASQDLSIKLWDLNSGRMIKSMTGHTQPIHSLNFSAESSVLVSGGADCTVRVWDAKTMGGKSSALSGTEANETIDLLTTYRTKRTPVTTTHFTPRNLCLVAGTFIDDQAH